MESDLRSRPAPAAARVARDVPARGVAPPVTGRPGADQGVHPAHGHPDPRRSVAELVSRHGPVTATVLAERLQVTPAAVRRHLDSLTADGLVTSRELVGTGPRGRGRPARAFVLTAAGQDRFRAEVPGSGRDDLAASALRFLDRAAGRQAVAAFARERAEELRARLAPAVDAAGPDLGERTRALAGALDAAGYAASTRPAATGTQICQGQCPVHRIAADFPELCEAETAAFAEVLGAPVQRLSTMAGGAHVCTTHISGAGSVGVTVPVRPAPRSARPAPLSPQPVPPSPRPAPSRTDDWSQARPGERTKR